MLWGKKRQQIERLKNRIERLEEIICPCGQHDWVCCGREHEMFGPSVETEYQYVCKKCNKVMWSFEPPWMKSAGRVNDATE